jgi:hypothetical protein
VRLPIKMRRLAPRFCKTNSFGLQIVDGTTEERKAWTDNGLCQGRRGGE